MRKLITISSILLLGICIILYAGYYLSVHYILPSQTWVKNNFEALTLVNYILTGLSLLVIIIYTTINYLVVKEMKDTRLASLKPYLRIKRTIEYRKRDDDETQHDIINVISIKNYSNAPAIDIDILVKYPYPIYSQSADDWFITNRPLSTYKLFEDGNEIHQDYVSLEANQELTFELIALIQQQDEHARIFLQDKYEEELKKAREKYKELSHPYNLYEISIQYKDILGNSYHLMKQTFPFPSCYDAAEEDIKELKKRFEKGFFKNIYYKYFYRISSLLK